MQEWVEVELASADLGDSRRNDRLRKLVEQCSQNPEGTFNQVCPTKADKKAAYRFVENEAIAPADLRQPHYDATWRRAASYERVLVLQDTSSISLTSHPATTGLGRLDSNYGRGFLVHSGLAVTATGEPLGLVHQEVWARQEEEHGQSAQRRNRPWQEKESYKWQRTMETVQASLPPGTHAIVLGDRESDVHGLLASPRPSTMHLLVRSAQNRRLANGTGSLQETLRKAPLAGQLVVEVARARDREPRRAVCDVRYQELTLSPPRHADAGVPKVPVTVWAVSVRERRAPKGQARVSWLLLATWPVHSFAEAAECARLYALRWLVERYHFVLKSGCRLEEAQLRTQQRLERLLALYCIVAWRLLALTYRARTAPTSSCEVLFTPLEWQLLYLHEHRVACPTDHAEPPTIQETVLWTAKLGGYWGRKGDAPPGVKALWRGLTRLHDMVLGYTLATDSTPVQICG